jgi:tetratricopeptide (TPR) repeat protein
MEIPCVYKTRLIVAFATICFSCTPCLAQTLSIAQTCNVEKIAIAQAPPQSCELARDVRKTCIPDSKDNDPLPNSIARYGTKNMEEYLTRRGACRKAIDEEFIRSVLCGCKGDRDCVFADAVQLGWNYLKNGDSTVAMRRFNQAWLVKPDSADVYWGFGAVYGDQRQFDKSIEMFDNAIALNDKNRQLPVPALSALYCDYGYTLLLSAAFEEGANERSWVNLERSSSLFQKSKEIHPDSGCCTYWKWAVTLFAMGNYKEAWQKVHLSQSQEKQCEIYKPFLEALRKVMPEPSK